MPNGIALDGLSEGVLNRYDKSINISSNKLYLMFEMIRTKVKVGEKGQIVIPKIIRENLGIVENREVLLEVKEKTLEVKAMPEQDLIKKMKERAKKHGGNVSKWVYGDKIYEEAFG